MNHDLVRPCPHCPFRQDIPPYLRVGRAQEIAVSLANGDGFPCHRTVDYEAAAAEGVDPTTGDQMCAGAMIALERMEAPTQLMRIAERTGAYDRDRLDMSSPVGDLDDFVRHHAGLEDDDHAPDCCSVCDHGCLAPAGYAAGAGGAVRNYDIDPDDLGSCALCGDTVCNECGPYDPDAEGQVCNFHGEEEGYE